MRRFGKEGLTSSISIASSVQLLIVERIQAHFKGDRRLDLFQIRFWPFMADTFVDVAIYGHNYVCGDILYGFLYPSTGEHVKFSSINPEKLDQSVRDVYDYPSGARRVHHFRMKLEVYFGVPPLSFFCVNSASLKSGKDRIHQIVDTYSTSKTLPRKGISRTELKEMVCHEGKWYATKDELERAIERKREQAAYEPWAVPDWMLKPNPPKRIVRRRKRRIH